MIPASQTNRVYVSQLLWVRYREVWLELTAKLKEHKVQVGEIGGTRDIWCRDYMPLQVARRRFVKFEYRPDYLDEYPEIRTARRDIHLPEELRGLWLQTKNKRIKLDGGNVVTMERDGAGGKTRAIVVDKVYRENEEKIPKGETNKQIEASLEVEMVVIPKEPYDVVGHSDGVVWPVSSAKVLVNDYSESEPAYWKRLTETLKRAEIEYQTIPYVILPNRKQTLSAYGNYVNILRVGNLVLVPRYNRSEDKEALSIVRENLSQDVVVDTVDCSVLAHEGGCINCVTWGIQV